MDQHAKVYEYFVYETACAKLYFFSNFEFVEYEQIRWKRACPVQSCIARITLRLFHSWNCKAPFGKHSARRVPDTDW